jgi:hypothetical protein
MTGILLCRFLAVFPLALLCVFLGSPPFPESGIIASYFGNNAMCFVGAADASSSKSVVFVVSARTEILHLSPMLHFSGRLRGLRFT